MPAPDGLKARGAELWYSLGYDTPNSAAGAMAFEACRVLDRLDAMDGVIDGKGILRLMHFRRLYDDDEQRVIVLQIDEVLAEVRQQQLTFARLLNDLDAVKGATKPKAASALDEFSARRSASGRGAASAHSPRANGR